MTYQMLLAEVPIPKRDLGHKETQERLIIDRNIIRHAYPEFNPEYSPPLRIKNIIRYYNDYIETMDDIEKKSDIEGAGRWKTSIAHIFFKEQECGFLHALYERAGVVSLYLGEIFAHNDALDIAAEFFLSSASCFIASKDYIRANFALRKIKASAISKDYGKKADTLSEEIPEIESDWDNISREDIYFLDFIMSKVYELLDIDLEFSKSFEGDEIFDEIYAFVKSIIERKTFAEIIKQGIKAFDKIPDSVVALKNKTIFLSLLREFEEVKHIWEKSKEKLNPEVDPLNYALTQIEFGKLLQGLMVREERLDYAQQAIKCYQKALGVFRFNDFPKEYALTHIAISATYNTISNYKNPTLNSKRAIESCKKAERILTTENYPEYYAMNQTNLGIAYYGLAQTAKYKLDKFDYCSFAKAAYLAALQIQDSKRYPYDYARIQINLGNINRWLALLAESEWEKKKYGFDSVQSFKNALEFFYYKKTPLDYAMTYNNLGEAYVALADITRDSKYCIKAISSCHKAFRVYSPSIYRLNYAKALAILGSAYGSWAKIDRTSRNCKTAIAAFQEASRILTKEKYPDDYKHIRTRLRKYCNVDLDSLVGQDFRLNYQQLKQFFHRLTQLEFLKQLDLSKSRLTQLPPELGQLQHLEQLNLSKNQLTQLPPELGQLHNL
ncbi:MAG: hypothetical protein ACE5OZ_08520, partial [Candidatus Heimdallarchaeota archaeon]